MNKTDYNRITTLYKSGGISEALVAELFISKGLSEVPGLELEHFVIENAIKGIANAVDTFYKAEVFTGHNTTTAIDAIYGSQNGQNLTNQLTNAVDELAARQEDRDE